MATITGLTAARMLLIEAKTVVSGIVQDGNLILLQRDGSEINAGALPPGPEGPVGSIEASPAGGDLSGNYPNPTIAKDGDPAVATMRSLGDGAQQAAAGDHTHSGLLDSGWVNFVPKAGEAPFAAATSSVTLAQYRKIGRLVHVRIEKAQTAARDVSGNSTGNLGNIIVMGADSLPAIARPVGASVNASARNDGSPITVVVNTGGSIIWDGGFPRNYQNGAILRADIMYFTDA